MAVCVWVNVLAQCLPQPKLNQISQDRSRNFVPSNMNNVLCAMDSELVMVCSVIYCKVLLDIRYFIAPELC